MRSPIIAATLVLCAATLAALQFSETRQLRAALVSSEAARAALEAKVAENAAQQASMQQQVATLQKNLQSSSRQLLLLSNSLQEAREMIQEHGTQTPWPLDTGPLE